MTQSGQGGEPSARTPREGVVLPSDGGAPLLPGEQAAPAAGGAWDQSWGPNPSAAPAAPAAQQWGGQGWDASQPQGQPQPAATAGPLPPEGAHAPSYGTEPPSYGAQGYGAPAQPGPPVAEAATQYIPPVPAGPVDEAATQYLPPVPGAAGDAATQYMSPAGPGALPPEVSGPGAAGPGSPDAQATQYLPPVPPQPQQPGAVPPQPYGAGAAEERRTPDVFDNLFRSEQGGAAAGATQELPRQSPQGQWQAQGQAAASPVGGRAAARHDTDRGRGRTGSRVPMLAAVGVGIAVLGIGAGALLAGGGGEQEQDQDTDRTVAAVASEAAASPSPSVDPAKEQAVALDKLLADSGASRESVIRSVEAVKGCDNLQQAATDLREAAQQRTGLVTRLSELSVDKLPDHAALTTALTNAWKASASADNHYAAWADQVAGKKGCHKGQARTTNHTQAGNNASGTASAEKTKAAKLWNTIASAYGLTQRQASQL